MKTKEDKLPYGHPSTLRDAPLGHKCKGFAKSFEHSDMALSKEQKKWLKTAKKSRAWM